MKHAEKYVLVPFAEYKKTSTNCDSIVIDSSVQGPGLSSEPRAGDGSVEDNTPYHNQAENMQNAQDFNVDNFITYLSKCGDGMCEAAAGGDETPLSTQPLQPAKKAKRNWISI